MNKTIEYKFTINIYRYNDTLSANEIEDFRAWIESLILLYANANGMFIGPVIASMDDNVDIERVNAEVERLTIIKGKLLTILNGEINNLLDQGYD